MLGGIGLSAAGVRPGPRDGFIGWPADARVANIGKVVCSNRFILLSGVRARVSRPGPSALRRRASPTTGRPPVASAPSWRRPSQGPGCPA